MERILSSQSGHSQGLCCLAPEPLKDPQFHETQTLLSPINVFQIGTGWFPERKGGAENVFYHLYKGLNQQGFDVRGVLPGTNAVWHDTGGTMRSFSAEQSALQRAASIRQAARDSFATAQPNIVASHFAFYTLPLLGWLKDVPLVTHFHGPWSLESLAENGSRAASIAKRSIERLVYRRARRVIVLSEAFGRIVQEQYGVSESAIRLIPGGVDCRQFDSCMSKAEARSALGWDRNRPAIFVVRRLVKRMGLDKLVEAMALVRQQSHGADAMLYIAGTGPERIALERLVVERELSDTVRFEGFLPDERLRLAYRAAEVTVIPTAALEGFGLVAIESMASGTPVLTTPVGGLPEVVSGLSQAMVLRDADARTIAGGIIDSLTDSGFLPDDQTCREYARRKFDWSVIVPQVASVYRELLS